MTAGNDRHALDRVYALFNQAKAMPRASQEPFVRREAGGDDALASEVLALLAGATREEGRTLLQAVHAAAALPKTADMPSHIGAYQLLRSLGEGGMGVVYLAEQQEPVQRQVALKVIKLGMDSKAVVARFEQERQALARMQHDGIAKVFDCGTTDRGQPFFVMELVAGEPLTDYCDRLQLPLRERLVLLQQVCAAVQHAHQKGVMHRDLKPSNILVTSADQVARVKVIDFGLAKIVDPTRARLRITEVNQRVGTPEYMAPEQADGSVDVDTRADVYSLGVVLYELLVGALPFSSTQVRAGGQPDRLRRLHECEPERPSSRLTGSAAAADIARSRGLTRSALVRVLANDLDWVVMKAMAREVDHRYESPGALAADLQHFLADEPLVAGPPSAHYRVAKFVRRHRAPLLVGAVLAVVIGVSTVLVAMASARGAVFAAENDLMHAKEEFRSAILWEWADAGPGGMTMKAGGKQRTAEELGRILERCPSFDLARQYRAIVLEELGRLEEARSLQLQVTADHTYDDFFIARQLAHKRQRAEALPMLERFEGDPLVGSYVLELSAVLLTTGNEPRYEDGIALLWRAEGREPLHPLFLYNLVTCYFQLGYARGDKTVSRRLPLLRSRVDRALMTSAESGMLQLARGLVAIMDDPGDFATQRRYFEQAIAGGMAVPLAYANLAITWLNEAAKAGDEARQDSCLERAKEILLDAQATVGEDAKCQVTLAKIHLGLRDHTSARACALKAEKLGGDWFRGEVEQVLKHTGR